MRVSGQIRDYLSRLHPDQRRVIKAALRALAAGVSADTLALTDNFEGLYRLRVGKFRIIYRFLADGKISCEFIDVRATVYERFATMREAIEASWWANEPAAPYLVRSKTRPRAKPALLPLKQKIRRKLAKRAS